MYKVETYIMKRYVRVAEYAESKSITPMTVRNLIHGGFVPAIVIGRLILIDPIEADRALERFRRGAKAPAPALAK